MQAAVRQILLHAYLEALPLYGVLPMVGANEAVLQMLQKIGSKENIPAALARAKDKRELHLVCSITLSLLSWHTF